MNSRMRSPDWPIAGENHTDMHIIKAIDIAALGRTSECYEACEFLIPLCAGIVRQEVPYA